MPSLINSSSLASSSKLQCTFRAVPFRPHAGLSSHPPPMCVSQQQQQRCSPPPVQVPTKQMQLTLFEPQGSPLSQQQQQQQQLEGSTRSFDFDLLRYGTAGALALAAAFTPCLAAHANQLAGEIQNTAAFFPGLVGDSPLREGFVSAFLLIFFSEIGDKTFFIAVLLALQQPKSIVFAGTFGALAVMTVISVGLGRVLHVLDELVPSIGVPLDDALAVALLIFFGVQTLRNAATADEDAAGERDEALEVVEGMTSGAALGMIASTFALVFAAEWGDKSFLATIALAAASDPVGVVAGAVAGHGAATVIAVLGGSFLGKYMSEKTVQYVGGSLFLVFAASTLFDIIRGV